MDARDGGADAEVDEHFRNAYDANGIDRSLVRQALAMSPTERLDALEARLGSLRELLAARVLPDR